MSFRIRSALAMALLVVSCEKIERPAVQPLSFAKPPTIVLQSGRGTGQYDQMTYAEYESSLQLTPRMPLSVTSLIPDVWFGNGTSGYLVHIRDEKYLPIAAEAGLVDGGGDMTPTFPDRQLDSPLVLQAGSSYTIVMKVWTTKSIGIYTTGTRLVDTDTLADYAVQSSTIPERGAIAFKFLR